MQALYRSSSDLHAEFTESVVDPSAARSPPREGTLGFGGPELIRFDYEDGAPRTFLVRRHPADPGLRVVSRLVPWDAPHGEWIDAPYNAGQLAASGLWGSPDLERDYQVSAADRPDLSAGVAVALTPKKTADATLRKIYLVVDPASYAVVESLVVAASGREDRFVFKSFTHRSLPKEQLQAPPHPTPPRFDSAMIDRGSPLAGDPAGPLPPPRGPPGHLVIRVLPWASVIIDGRLVGTTPFEPIDLPSGRHEVELINDELHVKRVLNVDVTAGETATVNEKLE